MLRHRFPPGRLPATARIDVPVEGGSFAIYTRAKAITGRSRHQISRKYVHAALMLGVSARSLLATRFFEGHDERLVGAVGIENNDVWDFKDLRGMTRNIKSSKRNDEACKGILIAPSKLPRFSRLCEIPTPCFFHSLP
jgi:hypothetical protein